MLFKMEIKKILKEKILNIEDEIFYNHLLWEFSHVLSGDLFESHGYYDNSSELLNEFVKTCYPHIVEVLQNQTSERYVYTFNKEDFYTETFFNTLTLDLTLTYGENGNYNGGYVPKNSSIKFINGQTKEIYFAPFIRLSIIAQDEKTFENTILFAFGHELTHCYNVYQYFKKTNGKHIEDYLKQSNYNTVVNAYNKSVGNTKTITRLLYLLNRMERNAYIAQLKQELESNKFSFSNSKEAMQAIKQTNSYIIYTEIKNIVQMLNNTELNVITKKNIIKEINTLTKNNFQNWQQILKYFNNRWSVWSKKYMITASKIACDVYNQVNESFIYDDFNCNHDLGLLSENYISDKIKIIKIYKYDKL